MGANTLAAVWFCGKAVVFLSLADMRLLPDLAASSLALLSGVCLDEVGDDEEEEEEVSIISLLEFDLMA